MRPSRQSFVPRRSEHYRQAGRIAALGLALAIVWVAAACSENRSPLEVNGTQTHTTSMTVGQELGIRLFTLGPGSYLSPPTLSDSALQFLDDAVVGPNNPGGPTQLFRFKAVARGRSIVTFQHSTATHGVTDTVIV